MIPLHWLIRAKRWAAHPPPLRRVVLVLSVIAACLALVLVERVFGLPDWMAVNSLRTNP